MHQHAAGVPPATLGIDRADQRRVILARPSRGAEDRQRAERAMLHGRGPQHLMQCAHACRGVDPTRDDALERHVVMRAQHIGVLHAFEPRRVSRGECLPRRVEGIAARHQAREFPCEGKAILHHEACHRAAGGTARHLPASIGFAASIALAGREGFRPTNAHFIAARQAAQHLRGLRDVLGGDEEAEIDRAVIIVVEGEAQGFAGGLRLDNNAFPICFDLRNRNTGEHAVLHRISPQGFG